MALGNRGYADRIIPKNGRDCMYSHSAFESHRQAAAFWPLPATAQTLRRLFIASDKASAPAIRPMPPGNGTVASEPLKSTSLRNVH